MMAWLTSAADAVFGAMGWLGAFLVAWFPVVVSLVVGLLALALFLLLFPRWAAISWSTARPLYVAMYFCKLAWCIWLMYTACRVEAEWGQLFGVVGILCWALNTRRQWGNGPPRQVLSGPMPFDERPVMPEWDRRRRRGSAPGGRERRAED